MNNQQLVIGCKFMDKTFSKISLILISFLVFILPVFFLTTTSDFYDFNKLTLLVVGVALVFLISFLGQFAKAQFVWKFSPLDLSVVLLAVAYIAATLVKTPNKVEALTIPGTTTLILGVSLLYFAIVQVINKDTLKYILASLLGGAVLLSVFEILAAFGLLSSIGFLAPVFKSAGFTPSGNPFLTSLFLGSLIPYLILAIVSSIKENQQIGSKGIKVNQAVVFFIALLIVSAGLAAGVSRIFAPSSQLRLVPFKLGWEVAVDSIKLSPIFGVGPGEYLSAFSRFISLPYNQTSLWAVRFANSTNWPLQIATETGLLGLASLTLLLVTLLKRVRELQIGSLTQRTVLYLSTLGPLLVLFIFPASLLVLVVFYSLTAAVAATDSREIRIREAKVGKILSGGTLVGFFLLILALIVFGAKAYAAEVTFKKAQDAIRANLGTESYNLIREAIIKNPYISRYRITYSQINLALANSLAQKGEGLTDQDKNTISTLIQQAIREGKVAVTLSPNRPQSWENLGIIYRSLIPFAQGADNFAIVAYNQAVSLDPINPNLRISLGGIFYALGRFDDAIRAFELSVLAKADFANGLYNLSAAYREKGEIEKAIEAMKQVLALLPQDSNDYNTAKSELEALEKRRPVPQTPEEQPPGELTAPRPAPSAIITPKLELPEEASPPAVPAGEESNQ